jgi:hypothetical protein
MARALRVLVPGAWYHVVNRGIERRLIFYGEAYYAVARHSKKKARLIRPESSGKTALHRYRGAFRAILWGNVQKGAADLHLLAVARLVSPELGPQPQREEIQPSAKQWRNFRKRSIGSTSGAGNLITLIQPSATGPVGRLKSFTRIDR